jgi:hypothetical protein
MTRCMSLKITFDELAEVDIQEIRELLDYYLFAGSKLSNPEKSSKE